MTFSRVIACGEMCKGILELLLPRSHPDLQSTTRTPHHQWFAIFVETSAPGTASCNVRLPASTGVVMEIEAYYQLSTVAGYKSVARIVGKLTFILADWCLEVIYHPSFPLCHPTNSSAPEQ